MLGFSPLSSSALASPIGQSNYLFIGQDLLTGEVLVSQATMAEAETFASDGLLTGLPDLGSGQLIQAHLLDTSSLFAQAPAIEDPSLSGDHKLGASSPTLLSLVGSTQLQQLHQLGSPNLITDPAEVSVGSLEQAHALLTEAMVTGSVTLPVGVLKSTHILSGQPLLAGIPLFGEVLVVDNRLIVYPDLGSNYADLYPSAVSITLLPSQNSVILDNHSSDITLYKSKTEAV